MSTAYAYCERLARAHYENFPVASRLLPPAMRPSIAAIYAFARTADDFADEPGRPPEERLRLLDDWQRKLHSSPPAGEPVFVALADTIERHRLPMQLFDDLLSAFRQDVTTCRYETWASLLDYCRRSANPVGRLVLRVAGYDNSRLDAWSDAVCTALQLTNFWQDLARDWASGRLYVPLEDVRRTGAAESDLDARHVTPAWQAALASASLQTRARFAEGRPVCDAVRGRLRWQLRFTWLGGSRILDELERIGYDVFRVRPALGARDVPALVLGALRWSGAGARPAPG